MLPRMHSMCIVTFSVFLVEGGKDVGVYVELSTVLVVLRNTFLLTAEQVV